MYIEKFKDKFLQLEFLRLSNSLRYEDEEPCKSFPCTEQEIYSLEADLSITLPKAYKEFLLWGGHEAGGLFEGSDCFLRHLLNIQEWAIDLLNENSFLEILPKDAFVFYMHQGYEFMFFNLSEGDDPPIYIYNEQNNHSSFVKAYPKYSEFLLTFLEEQAKYLKIIYNF